MTHTIKIEVEFRAGHRLIAPYEGKCNNLHGEGYTAICEFESEVLDKSGMVIDFGEVKREIKNWIDSNWDHSYIHHKDDEIGEYLKGLGMKTFEMENNPTAEYMAQILYYNIALMKRIVGATIKKVGIVESFRDNIAYYEE